MCSAIKPNCNNYHSVVIVPESKNLRRALWKSCNDLGVTNYIDNGVLTINLKKYAWKGSPIVGEYEKLCYLFTMFMNNEKERSKLEFYLKKYYTFDSLVFRRELYYVDSDRTYDSIDMFLNENMCGETLKDFLRDNSQIILMRYRYKGLYH